MTSKPSDEEVLVELTSFWGRLVETDGQLDRLKVARELFDYRRLLREIPKVFKHVTGGALSNPHYPADTVISTADETSRLAIEFAITEDRAMRGGDS